MERNPDEFDTPPGARLTALMERAAADAQRVATTPAVPDIRDRRRPPKRWVVATLASAAAIALVAAGVVAIVRDDEGTSTLQTADSVPAPEDRSSMWRVPTELPDGFELGWASTNSVPATLVAVDDPDDVSRWVVVSFMSLGFQAPVFDQTAVGTAHIFYRRVEPTGSDRNDPVTGEILHAAITGSQSSLSFVSIMSHGVDEALVRQAAEAMAQVVSDGVDAGSSGFAAERAGRLQSMLDAMVGSPLLEGLTRLGTWESPDQPVASIGVTPVSSSAEPTTTDEAPEIMTGPPPSLCTVTAQSNPGPAATALIDDLYARSTFGPMIVPGARIDIDLPGATAWWTELGLMDPPGTSSGGVRVVDGSALVDISCSGPAADHSVENVRMWAIELAEGLATVADEAAFNAWMEAHGVTTNGG